MKIFVCDQLLKVSDVPLFKMEGHLKCRPQFLEI